MADIEKLLNRLENTWAPESLDGFLAAKTIRTLQSKLAAARAGEDAVWLEALTPSMETKATYIGEFTFEIEDATFDGNYTSRPIQVPWTTIKEIMAAIKARALTRPTPPTGEKAPNAKKPRNLSAQGKFREATNRVENHSEKL